MNESIISVRYSKALFQSALGNNILEKVNSDMELISEICNMPETREFLQNPVIPPSKKSQIFNKMFGSNVEKITMSLIDLLCKNGREAYLPSIARVFRHETLKYKGITRSVLTTAVKLDDPVRKKIRDLISGKFDTKVELEELVDPSLIGGFILRVEDSYLDASIRNKLNRIKKELNRSSLTSE
jgi:F-type H+-transporting ATPase subunit delta